MGNARYLAFIGTNSVRGSKGIYSVAIDAETLKPEIVSTHQVYNTGTMCISKDRNVFYAGIEGMTFKGLADGGCIGYAFEEDGTIREVGAARSHGQRTCTISVDEKTENVYGCNFYEGTFCKWPLNAEGGPTEAEFVIAPPDIPGAWKALHGIAAIGDKYVGIISLTETALVIYRTADGSRVTSYPFPDHPFCRYLEVSGKNIYALMQDPGDIYVFANHLDENGTIEMIQKISVLPEKLERYGNTTIRMTPNGQLMLVACRNNNSLSVFHIEADGTLTLKSVHKLPGETPRDFAISRDGRIVVACLQKTNEISTHFVDYEKEELVYSGYKVSIPSPAAAVVTERR